MQFCGAVSALNILHIKDIFYENISTCGGNSRHSEKNNQIQLSHSKSHCGYGSVL